MQIKIFTFNPYQENTYVLFDDTGSAIIIDPGMLGGHEQNQVVAFIKQAGLKLERSILTHAHIDHVLGNKFVFDQWGLKPELHKGELMVLQAVASYAPQMGIPYELSPEPEHFLKEGEIISFGNTKLEVILAPGHSPAHLCFYEPLENILIGGDVLFYQSIGRTDLPGGNHHTLLKSIREKLFILPDDCVVYPGHGQATRIGFEKLHNPFLQA
ncbi:MAG: MBL fold metallo-hydrolase [Pedobacter sp.]|nr:MAG: MBL fold metallo-hydrolase [Pedobacter sp.]